LEACSGNEALAYTTRIDLPANDASEQTDETGMMLGKPATSDTLLIVNELTSNKMGNKAATDQQHSFQSVRRLIGTWSDESQGGQDMDDTSKIGNTVTNVDSQRLSRQHEK